MPTPEVSIVVVHHRGLEHLLEALAALDASAREGLTAEILLVDNASGTPQDEVLRRHPSVRRIPSAVNVGFASGCRLGVEAARAPLVLFVNDDAVVRPDAPRLLVSALAAAGEDVVAVGGRMTDRTGRRNDFSDGFLTFDGHAFAAHVGRAVESLPPAEPGEERLFASGGLMAVRRADFLASGGFDDDYFAYLEDVDFGWRQWIRGTAHPGRAPGVGAPPRRRDRRGTRRLLAGLPLREERVRHGLQELRRASTSGPSCRPCSWRS